MTEKVKVPKVFDEWIRCKFRNNLYTAGNVVSAISEINDTFNAKQFGLDGGFDEVEHYIADNYVTAIRAVVDGYEVEEPKRGFKLDDGDYVECLLEGYPIAFVTIDKFVAADDWTLNEAQKYLKGKIVTEEEVDD